METADIMANLTNQKFDVDDLLGIRWRTFLGIRLGLEPKEAYEMALGLAGVR